MILLVLKKSKIQPLAQIVEKGAGDWGENETKQKDEADLSVTALFRNTRGSKCIGFIYTAFIVIPTTPEGTLDIFG